MKEQFETVRKTLKSFVRYFAHGNWERSAIQESLAALTKIEAEHERVTQERPSVIRGLRRRLHMLEGHNQHFERCESAWCNPPRAEDNAADPIAHWDPALNMGIPDAWPAAPEQKEPAQPPAPMWAEVRSKLSESIEEIREAMRYEAPSRVWAECTTLADLLSRIPEGE